MQYFLISIFILVGSLSSATAQQSGDNKPISADNWVLSQLSSFAKLRTGGRLDQFKKQIATRFRRIDHDGGGISKNDYDLQVQIIQAAVRAHQISNWARNDLNGDGSVSRDEFTVMVASKVPLTLKFGGETVAASTEQRAKLTQKNVDKKMKADIDNDGAVSMQEAIAATGFAKSIRSFRFRNAKQLDMPPSLDGNKDGTVTLEEFTIATDRILKRLDTDRNDILDREEISYYHQLRRRAVKALPHQQNDRSSSIKTRPYGRPIDGK